jgi:hypothetical protein
MFVESLISDTEELLEKISLKDLINLWNEVFPEETIPMTDAKEYSADIVEEIRSMIVDELQDTGLERLIMIHNQVAEEKITEDDIYEETDFDDMDENGEYL